MCARYTQFAALATLRKRFAVPKCDARLVARYNVAPTQEAPVVLLEGGRKLELLRWGLVPSWSKDPSIGQKTINARAETLPERASFRGPLKSRRCLVVTDGFYEWKTVGGKKKPIRFSLKGGEPFAFAGLWDVWKKPEGGELRSFTIVTTEANALIRPVHDRMPAILSPEEEDQWLAGEPQQALKLLKPLAPERMQSAPASPLVNSAANEGPALLEYTEPQGEFPF